MDKPPQLGSLQAKTSTLRWFEVQVKFVWSASQVCLECKPSLLGVQAKFAHSASQVALHDKPPPLSHSRVKAIAFIDLEYTPSHLRPQASSIE